MMYVKDVTVFVVVRLLLDKIRIILYNNFYYGWYTSRLRGDKLRK